MSLSFAHPFGNPRRAETPPGHLLAGAQVPADVRALMERICANCHSEAVEWPIYSRIAPVSWLLERDVSVARARMNLSHWEGYSKQEKSDLLGSVAAEVHSGEMPPARYTAIHRDARLSPEERQAIYAWAKAERKRIRAGE